jgi:predicted xylose isomerase-like sugar epimerase
MVTLHERVRRGETLAVALHAARSAVDRDDPHGLVNWCGFTAVVRRGVSAAVSLRAGLSSVTSSRVRGVHSSRTDRGRVSRAGRSGLVIRLADQPCGQS